MPLIDQKTGTLEMDRRISHEIPELLAMAHDRTESGRLSLVKKLADTFLTSSITLTNDETEQVNQLIDDLLKTSAASVRQALINEFTCAASAPRNIAIKIASAPIEIARPTLTNNENLADDDLITIIQNQTSDHAAAIATRKQISETVADALITTGDISIMQIVAENLGAKLSGRAIELLVDAGRLASLLQKPIMSRPELNPESAARLYWWVSKDLRRATLEKFGFGPGKLDAALSKATDEILSALLLQKEDDNAMSYLADWLQERGALTTDLLPRLLRAGHYRLFNYTLSRLSHLDMATIDYITSAAGNRHMVILCRALGIDKGSFVSIFLMARGGRSDDQIIHPRELSQAIAAYDKLSLDMAQSMLQRWRSNPGDVQQSASARTALNG